MHNIHRLICLLVFFLFVGCATSTSFRVPMTQEYYPPKFSPDQVKLYKLKPPKEGSYKIIGSVFAQTPILYYSYAEAYNKTYKLLKKEAQQLGADGIINIKTETIEDSFNEILKGQGQAIVFVEKKKPEREKAALPIQKIIPKEYEVTRKIIDKFSNGISKTIIYYKDGKEIAKEIFNEEGNIIGVNGKIPDGIVKEYDENNNLKAEWNYYDGKLNGTNKTYKKNGELSSDFFYIDGILESMTFYSYYEPGKIKSEEIIYTNNNGITKTYYKDGTLKAEGNFKDGKRNGVIKTYYEDGKLETEANYKNGKRNGVTKTYYEDGTLQLEANFKDDKRNGISKLYSEDGILKAEGNFKNDKLNGIYKEYYEDGKLETEYNFKDGKRNGITKTYYENGTLKAEGNFKDGKRNGVIKTYYEDGKLETEGNYKNGKRNGVTKTYYEDGTLQLEVNFKDDKRNGISKLYSEDGRILYIDTYKNDQKINRKAYDAKGKLEFDQDYPTE